MYLFAVYWAFTKINHKWSQTLHTGPFLEQQLTIEATGPEALKCPTISFSLWILCRCDPVHPVQTSAWRGAQLHQRGGDAAEDKEQRPRPAGGQPQQHQGQLQLVISFPGPFYPSWYVIFHHIMTPITWCASRTSPSRCWGPMPRPWWRTRWWRASASWAPGATTPWPSWVSPQTSSSSSSTKSLALVFSLMETLTSGDLLHDLPRLCPRCWRSTRRSRVSTLSPTSSRGLESCRSLSRCSSTPRYGSWRSTTRCARTHAHMHKFSVCFFRGTLE